MIGDFLLRLAVALPLILMLAVGVLLAARRGWIPLPGGPAPGLPLRWRRGAAHPPADAPPTLDVVAVRGVAPALRLAVVRFRDEELLVGVAPQGFQLLVRQSSAKSAAQLAEERQ